MIPGTTVRFGLPRGRRPDLAGAGVAASGVASNTVPAALWPRASLRAHQVNRRRRPQSRRQAVSSGSMEDAADRDGARAAHARAAHARSPRATPRRSRAALAAALRRLCACCPLVDDRRTRRPMDIIWRGATALVPEARSRGTAAAWVPGSSQGGSLHVRQARLHRVRHQQAPQPQAADASSSGGEQQQLRRSERRGGG